MASLYTETARFKWPGLRDELCFLWDTLLRRFSVATTMIMSGYRYNSKGTMMIRNPLVNIILMIHRVIPKRKAVLMDTKFEFYEN